MKRSFAVLFVLLLCFLLFINTSSGVELKLAHFVPTSHAMHAELIEPWAKEVERLTEGRVKITIYPNATLAKPADLYDSVVTGVAEIIYTLPSYTAGKFPLTEGFELPFIFNSAQHVTKTIYGIWDRILEFRKEYADTHILWIWAGDPGQLFTKKPIRSILDLKGLKIRVHGPSTKELASALGASPITAPVGEQYEMLKRGVIDGVFTPWSASMHFRLYEVTSYATVLNAYVPVMIVAMNKQAYEKLSPRDRKVLEDTTGRKIAFKGAAIYDDIAKKSIEIHRKANVQIHELTREEFEKWRSAVAPVYNAWIAKMEGKGLPGKRFFDEMMKLSREFEK
ncbi:MAG: TRAP transporter substrate-binding protein [Desulfobacterota bacterium]|nr:TRAP transporter substrate-binding protein [Thermodesulfobacteriota bacterium]MDW8001774.1 TRAP transporter substrate-binding protein [Deltaproteobacteria bacterium]